MGDWINIGWAALTLGFGAFGFLAPRYTAEALDFRIGASTMGLSELRASAGGLFVAMALVCLMTLHPMAFAMLGVAYAGAATGRLVSIVLDKPPMPKALFWFALEALPAAWLIGANWPAGAAGALAG